MLKPIMFWPRDTGELLEDDDSKVVREPKVDTSIEDHAILRGLAPSEEVNTLPVDASDSGE